MMERPRAGWSAPVLLQIDDHEIEALSALQELVHGARDEAADQDGAGGAPDDNSVDP
jgi:hypothetical protein